MYLHRRVGEVIEDLFRDKLEEQLEHLAYHYEHSGRTEKAVEYLLKAGDKSRRSYLHEEAVTYFQKALELLETLDKHEQHDLWLLDALEGLNRLYDMKGDMRLAEQIACEAIELGERIGLAPKKLARFYNYHAGALFNQSRYRELKSAAEQGLSLLGGEQESEEAVSLNYILSTYYLNAQGDQKAYRELNLENARFIARLPYSENLRWAMAEIGSIYVLAKEIEKAREWFQMLEEKAKEHDDLQSVAAAYIRLGYENFFCGGDLDQAISYQTEALKVVEKIGDQRTIPINRVVLGWFYEFSGAVEKTEEYSRQVVGVLEEGEKDILNTLGCAYRNLGTALCCLGDSSQGVQFFNKALQLYEQISEQWAAAEIALIGRGFLALRQAEKAEPLFRQVLRLLPPDPQGQGLFFLKALSGLEQALDDNSAFLAFCRELREKRPQLKGSRFQQWHLAGAEPLRFSREVGHDDFQDILSPEWEWHDPFSDCTYNVGDGLEIRAANGRDLWYINTSAPRISRPVSGDFVIQTVCAPALTDRPAIGGLYLWQDRKNFLHLEQGSFGRHELTFKGCLDAEDFVFGRGRLAADDYCLRLERTGERFRALCRAGEGEWFTVGQVEFPVSGPVEAGLFAGGWIDRSYYHGAFPDGAAMRFESFQMWQD